MILELNGITYSYPSGFLALNGVNASIKKKSFVVILGESGSGKTTLFKVISGLFLPKEGTITINDKDVTNLTTSSRDLTMIFQNFVLYPHMSIYENVMTALNGFGLSNEEIDIRSKNILSEFGLRDYLNFKPRHLSDGQKQRVAMCKALVREPSLLLMDEPLSNLDLPQRAKIKSELKDIYEKYDSSFIYITHELKDAEFLGTDIWMMDNGKVVQTGTIAQIRDNPKTFKSCFLIYGGAINEIKVKIEDGKIFNDDFSFAYDGEKNKGEYKLCLPYSSLKIDGNGPIKAIINTKKIIPEGILITASLSSGSTLSLLVSEDEDDENEYKEKDEIRLSPKNKKLFLYKIKN